MASTRSTQRRAQELIYQEFGLRNAALFRDPDLPQHEHGYRLDLGMLSIGVAEVNLPEGMRFRVIVSDGYGLGSIWMYFHPNTLAYDTGREQMALNAMRKERCGVCGR